jgi:hypothetical protein
LARLLGEAGFYAASLAHKHGEPKPKTKKKSVVSRESLKKYLRFA